jgi:Ran GTPase-activating protein (RanGAP) involved in mRNA processing and transport
MIYEYIKTFGKDLTCLKLKVIDKMSLKSNHYWLMAIIPKLTSLKTLKLYQNEANSFGEDGHKFLQKAMSYFHKNGGLLQKVQMSNVYQRTSGDFLYPTLKCLPDLQILSFKDNMLAANDCKAIGKVLSDFKNIRELDLRNCMLDTTKGKEIADGLMRAKQLEIIKLNDN